MKNDEKLLKLIRKRNNFSEVLANGERRIFDRRFYEINETEIEEVEREIAKEIKQDILNKKTKKTKIGDVIPTKELYNKCSCGKIVTIRRHIWFNDGENFTQIDKATIYSRKNYMGVCKCGNIFIT